MMEKVLKIGVMFKLTIKHIFKFFTLIILSGAIMADFKGFLKITAKTSRAVFKCKDPKKMLKKCCRIM